MPHARLLVALLAALLLFLGCTSTVPIGARGEPPAEEPIQPGGATPVSSPGAEGCLEKADSLPRGAIVEPYLQQAVQTGICHAKVHSDELWVALTLPPTVDPAAAQAALQTVGPAQPAVVASLRPDGLALDLRYPAGRPGDRLLIRLAGPFGPGGSRIDLGYDLERVATPQVLLEYRQGESPWRPLESGATLPRRPLELRLRASGGASLDEAAERLRQQGYSGLERVAGEAQSEGEALLLHLAEPPPHLLVNLDLIPANYGLVTRRSLWELFTGEPPELAALDPVTGQEQVIGQVPVNVYRALPSPDGQWAALLATHPQDLYAGEVWVVQTQTGRLYRTSIRYGFEGVTPHWRQDELVVPVYSRIHRWQVETAQTDLRQSHGTAFTAISPDRRYLAGIAYDMSREDQHFLAPATIVLHDLETGEDRLLAADQVRVRIPHSEIPARLPMAFSPDGSALLIDEPLPLPTGQSERGFRRLRLEIATGNLSEAPSEGERQAPPPWVYGPVGYAHNLQWDYAEILIREPSGADRPYGRGRIAGWLPDGRLLLIRWANSEWLRPPQGV